ncbi:MAG: efflux RND transporter periplasmic adaptor subunit [Planctomycetaceae bacterium]|nr:efflux RND transporter periplasmic adaptor subunit [Planctomycetaceae bacterium]
MDPTLPDILELGRLRIRLRDQVRIRSRWSDNMVVYQLECPESHRFFQIGRREYLLISCLDGSTSLAEAITAATKVLKTDTFSEQEAITIGNWLLESGLAVSAESGAMSSPPSKSKSNGAWNPFWIKIPLLRSDALLNGLMPLVGWIFSGPMCLVAMILLFWAMTVISGHYDQFLLSSQQLFSSTNWLSLLIVWSTLKVVHELAHGLVCLRYGGRVRELGVVFLFFVPLAYADVTTAWAMESRWKRIHVSLAGIFVELQIAALAVIAWGMTASPEWRHLLFNIFAMAGISTVLFNANPLMKFDGYYVLSDLLVVPNLWQQSSNSLTAWVRRLVYGTPLPQLGYADWRRWFVPGYGLAALFWRMMVCVTLLAVSSVYLGGAGIVVTILGIGLWGVRPVLQACVEFGKQLRRSPRRGFRAATILGALLLVGGYLVGGMPCPGNRVMPAVVEYTDLDILRAGTDGFIREVHVQTGQEVQDGQSLFVLDSPDLHRDIQDLKLQIEKTAAQIRVDRNTGAIAAAQVGERQIQALEKRLAQKLDQMDALVIRAPRGGRVSGGPFEHWVGRYIREGEELAAIGDEHQKELLVAASQEALEELQKHLQADYRARVSGQGTFSGTLSQVQPQARLQPPHRALFAPYGGTLAARAKIREDDGQTEYQLVEPRFEAMVRLTPETSGRLSSGQRAWLKIGFGEQSLAEVLYHHLEKWLAQLANDHRV